MKEDKALLVVVGGGGGEGNTGIENKLAIFTFKVPLHISCSSGSKPHSDANLWFIHGRRREDCNSGPLLIWGNTRL